MDVRRPLYEIWNNPEREDKPFHVQMETYVMHFETASEAERFVRTVKYIKSQRTNQS